jgi:phosphoglycerate kinase
VASNDLLTTRYGAALPPGPEKCALEQNQQSRARKGAVEFDIDLILTRSPAHPTVLAARLSRGNPLQPMPYKSIRDLDLAGKRVFIRVDFNVPLDETGTRISSDTRIRAALPTIKLALEKGAALVLASHLGRPKGKPNPKMQFDPVAARLAELLGRDVKKAPDSVGREVGRLASQLSSGEVLLLENLRFHCGEETNDSNISEQLAGLCDVYINDAFGAAHRAHASTAGMVGLVPQVAAGLLMEKELKFLSMAVSNPERPYVAIVGGAKISGKIDVLRSFLRIADKVLIGGAMTYTFLKAQGVAIGSSLVEDDKLGVAREAIEQGGDKLQLPIDHVIAQDLAADAATKIVDGTSEPIPAGWKGLDIGPKTIAAYREAISGARMIVWNGPMGVFEIEPFAAGTLAVAHAVADSAATSIVGGGDSEKAIKTAGVSDQMTHISTGGGASLEFLAGKKLPGVEALGGL